MEWFAVTSAVTTSLAWAGADARARGAWVSLADVCRQTMTDGARTSVDLTRYSQLGSWSGYIEVKGRRIDLAGKRVLGVRDHSWGVRPLGGGGSTRWAPQIHWYWGPIFFADECMHWHLNDNPDGDVQDRFAALVPRVLSSFPTSLQRPIGLRVTFFGAHVGNIHHRQRI